MATSTPDPLRLSRRILGALIKLNMIYGTLILVLLIASLFAEELIFGALGVQAGAGRHRLILGMRAVMVLGIAAVPLAHIVLDRLLAIVDTVGAGSPFVMENAERLRGIAWTVLGLEFCHLSIGLVAAWASTTEQPLDLDWSFSVTRWIVVLLLFVLARVFEQGARMREDLEGTV